MSEDATLAVCSLWHCPAGHPGSLLTTTLPCGARTFLGGGFPHRRDRPADHARGDGCLLGRRRFRILVFNVTVHGSCFDLETFARPGLQQRPLHVFPSQRRRRSVFGFQEHRLFQKVVRSFSPAMTLARPLRRLRSHDLLPRTVFSCLDLRAASSTICRADSCEPTRPIATDSAPHFRTSEARSS
jgi:hypothetical protein